MSPVTFTPSDEFLQLISETTQNNSTKFVEVYRPAGNRYYVNDTEVDENTYETYLELERLLHGRLMG